jgi:hypothetical protein
MQDPIVLILDESLEALERGGLTRTQCLERYPQHRGELAVLLDAALILRSSQLPTPNPAYFKAGRSRLVAKIKQEQQLTTVDKFGHYFRHLSTNAIRLRTASIALLLAFAFVILSGGTVYASAHALPGDTLYPLKTTLEDLRLELASNEGESILYEQLAERRLEEIQALLDAGREDEIVIAVARFEETLTEAGLLLENVKPEDEAWAIQKANHLVEQLSKHLVVLETLLIKMPTSPGIHRAIEVAERNILRMQTHFLPPEDVTQAPSKETDNPGKTDNKPESPNERPGGFGQPADTGKPEGVGKPEDVGKPVDLGKPEKEEKIKEEKVKEEKDKDKDKDTDTPEVEIDE